MFFLGFYLVQVRLLRSGAHGLALQLACFLAFYLEYILAYFLTFFMAFILTFFENELPIFFLDFDLVQVRWCPLHPAAKEEGGGGGEKG